MDSIGKPADRVTLHNEIWSEPLTLVAKRYGLSDVGLAKICKKLVIPIPSRGYWAKIRAGKIMRKIPLPPLPDVVYWPIGPVALTTEQLNAREAVKERRADLKSKGNNTPTVKEKVLPHPLVSEAAQRLQRNEGWTSPTGIRTAPAEVLDLAVTSSSLKRALSLTDVLLKAFAQLGVTADVDRENRRTVLNLNNTRVEFKLYEHVDQSNHKLTRAETRAVDQFRQDMSAGRHTPYPHLAAYDFHPTGKLTLTVGRYPRRNWNDTARTSLDDRVPEIVTEAVLLIESVRQRELEQARREAVRQAAIEVYERQLRIRASEQEKLRTLRSDATRFRKANDWRAYIQAVEAQARDSNEMTAELLDWINWARAKADWMDPLNRISDRILDAPKPERRYY